jgi:hypothetical protein
MTIQEVQVFSTAYVNVALGAASTQSSWIATARYSHLAMTILRPCGRRR